ncbi:MAG: hypothetical protein N2689_11820, partial [Verrucomicrobiae bacterium]|nr:hypothetical protein [Verrucomicrobiae bacterium]
MFAFDLGEGAHDAGGVEPRGHEVLELLLAQFAAGRHDGGLLQGVGQFAHVALPMVFAQQLHRPWADGKVLLHAQLDLPQQMLDQGRQVVETVGKWRHDNLDHREGVEQLAPHRVSLFGAARDGGDVADVAGRPCADPGGSRPVSDWLTRGKPTILHGRPNSIHRGT